MWCNQSIIWANKTSEFRNIFDSQSFIRDLLFFTFFQFQSSFFFEQICLSIWSISFQVEFLFLLPSMKRSSHEREKCGFASYFFHFRIENNFSDNFIIFRFTHHSSCFRIFSSLVVWRIHGSNASYTTQSVNSVLCIPSNLFLLKVECDARDLNKDLLFIHL